MGNTLSYYVYIAGQRVHRGAVASSFCLAAGGFVMLLLLLLLLCSPLGQKLTNIRTGIGSVQCESAPFSSPRRERSSR